MQALDKTLELASRFPMGRTALLTKLKNENQSQIKQITNLYNLTNTNSQQKVSGLGIEAVLANEANVLKSLIELLDLEDDEAKRLAVKNMLMARLDIISNS